MVTKKKAAKKQPVNKYGLSITDRNIADLYRGGTEEFIGNKKRCYMALHPRCSEKTAESAATLVFAKPAMVRYLRMKADQLEKKTDINAEWVLQRSMRLYEISIGDEKTKKTLVVEGVDIPLEVFEFNGGNVARALELIGKNVNVNAFKSIVDMNHSGEQEAFAELVKQHVNGSSSPV